MGQVFTTNSSPAAESNAQAPPPKSVETIVLISGTGNREVRLLGQVKAGESAALSSQLDGTVQSVLVSEGDRLRPIFMSAGTSVLGMIPLAVLPGKGVELYQGLGMS